MSTTISEQPIPIIKFNPECKYNNMRYLNSLVDKKQVEDMFNRLGNFFKGIPNDS